MALSELFQQLAMQSEVGTHLALASLPVEPLYGCSFKEMVRRTSANALWQIASVSPTS